MPGRRTPAVVLSPEGGALTVPATLNCTSFCYNVGGRIRPLCAGRNYAQVVRRGVARFNPGAVIGEVDLRGPGHSFRSRVQWWSQFRRPPREHDSHASLRRSGARGEGENHCAAGGARYQVASGPGSGLAHGVPTIAVTMRRLHRASKPNAIGAGTGGPMAPAHSCDLRIVAGCGL